MSSSSLPSYPDVLVHSEGGGIEDEVSVMEAARGQSQAQDAPFLSEFHHPMSGRVHFSRWRTELEMNKNMMM